MSYRIVNVERRNEASVGDQITDTFEVTLVFYGPREETRAEVDRMRRLASRLVEVVAEASVATTHGKKPEHVVGVFPTQRDFSDIRRAVKAQFPGERGEWLCGALNSFMRYALAQYEWLLENDPPLQQRHHRTLRESLDWLRSTLA